MSRFRGIITTHMYHSALARGGSERLTQYYDALCTIHYHNSLLQDQRQDSVPCVSGEHGDQKCVNFKSNMLAHACLIDHADQTTDIEYLIAP